MKNNYELNIQKAIVRLLRRHRLLVFSVPNGSHLPNPRTRIHMKEAGLLSGVSDLIIVLKEKIYFIEVKHKTKQSSTQKEFEEMVAELGHTYEVWYSEADAADFLEEVVYG